MKPDPAAIFGRALPTLEQVAEETGLSPDTLKSLSAGRRKGRSSTHRVIARWLRAQAARLLADADLLDPPTDPTP